VPDDRIPTLLARLPLFASLERPVLARLARVCTLTEVEEGAVVFTRGRPADCCYAVVSGVVELVTSNREGVSKVVEIIRADETFGEAVMFLRRPFPVDAVAASPAVLLHVPASAVDAVIEDDPHAARSMLASLSMRLHSLVRDVEMYTVQPARERVLGYIAESLPARTTETGAVTAPARVEFRPTKRSVASRLGITAETFSRTLRALRDEGILVADGSGVLVPDPDGLAAHRSRRA